MVSNIAEIIIFVLLGVTIVQEFMINFLEHWNTGFFFCTLIFVTIYRVIGVFGLTWICNLYRKFPIPINDQIVMSMSGLRGGIAFSLTKLLVHSKNIPHVHRQGTNGDSSLMKLTFPRIVSHSKHRSRNTFNNSFS